MSDQRITVEHCDECSATGWVKDSYTYCAPSIGHQICHHGGAVRILQVTRNFADTMVSALDKGYNVISSSTMCRRSYGAVLWAALAIPLAQTSTRRLFPRAERTTR